MIAKFWWLISGLLSLGTLASLPFALASVGLLMPVTATLAFGAVAARLLADMADRKI